MSKEIELECNSVGEVIRTAETNFINGHTLKSQYVEDSLYEDINTIEAYLNSKHTSGETDSLGREKPFFNIVLAARNICYRATDLDRKNVRIRATKKKNLVPAFLATQYLHSWMNKTDFGQFLNDWGLNLASYNSAVTKHVVQDGELKSINIPWTRIICDAVDFDNNPKIEILEFTPAQLRKKKEYDQDMVDSLIEATAARQTVGKQRKDNLNNYIKLYEIHGNMPLSYLTSGTNAYTEEDDDEYVQQMQVVSFVPGKKKGDYDDFVLVKGKEDKDPYMLTSLITNTDGSVSLNGSVKNLFQAQWMVNHTVKAIKDQLDLASKLIFQTSDGNFVGQNALTSIETGDIMIHAVNQPVTQVQNNSHDISSLQSFGQQWQVLAQNITSTPDIMRGDNMPSGTAFRQAAIIQQEAHDNFEIMTENKALALERMVREFIIPFIKTKLNTNEEITTFLSENDIKKIDSLYLKDEATRRTNKDIVELVLKGEDVTPEETELLNQVHTQGLKSALEEQGNQRFFLPSEISSETWKDAFEDLEWDVEVDITGENENKNAVLETLNTVFKTIVAMQGRPMTPEEKFVFNQILNEVGTISPIELSNQATPPAPVAPAAPVAPMSPTAPSPMGQPVGSATGNLQA